MVTLTVCGKYSLRHRHSLLYFENYTAVDDITKKTRQFLFITLTMCDNNPNPTKYQ